MPTVEELKAEIDKELSLLEGDLANRIDQQQVTEGIVRRGAKRIQIREELEATKGVPGIMRAIKTGFTEAAVQTPLVVSAVAGFAPGTGKLQNFLDHLSHRLSETITPEEQAAAEARPYAEFVGGAAEMTVDPMWFVLGKAAGAAAGKAVAPFYPAKPTVVPKQMLPEVYKAPAEPVIPLGAAPAPSPLAPYKPMPLGHINSGVFNVGLYNLFNKRLKNNYGI